MGILIILFTLLFLFEIKPMNKIFNFIGIIISVAIILGNNYTDYISYLLIIVYCSALTIIFGFVIMLSPDPKYPKYINKPYIFFPLLILFSSFPFFFYNSSFSFDTIGSLNDLKSSNDILINKIGTILYLDNLNIVKLMISLLILLLALIALFYILLPTF